MESVTKEAREQDGLFSGLRKDFVVTSMSVRGDCAYELMCRWTTILFYRRSGIAIPERILAEPVSKQQTTAMRHTIADLEQTEILEKSNSTMHTLVKQALVDWSRNPEENGGRNRQVADAVGCLPTGASEDEWFQSSQALDIHSSMVRSGSEQVFAESAEMEAFSILERCPLAVYIPRHIPLTGIRW